MKRLATLGLGACLLWLSGCSSVGYLYQSWQGQRALMARAEAIEQVIADPQTDPQLAERLRTASQIRRYAVEALELPDNTTYTRYAALPGPYPLWNLFVTDELSLAPVPHCYPFFGCIAYKGYFDQARAEQAADDWRARGKDVYVAGIPAYSTLGWYDDPLFSSMLHWSDDYLAEMLFHELAHQRFYVKDDTAFNESYASFVGQQGQREWLKALGREALDPVAGERLRVFVELVLGTRAELAALYQSEQSGDAKRRAKAALLAQLKVDYTAVRNQQWAGDPRFDHWFAADLNNARLLPFGLYDQWVPAFECLYQRSSGWADFHQRVEALGSLAGEARTAALGQQCGD
ncbi:MAG: aminopeptidase [Pseudomonas sp.]|uniref:aminopeptidase n=1 Tax=Pseudomonas sp. TaxID=306 RepID=UPI003242C3DD